MTTMTKKQRQDLIDHMKDTLTKMKGWEEDRWGNFKITVRGKQYRAKFQKTSLRLEVKVGSSWVRKESDYFKNIERLDNGFKIKNLTFEV